MITWKRTTRELSIDHISPVMTAAIQRHLDRFNLGPILKDYSMCIETVSKQEKKGLFGGGMMGVKIPKSTLHVSVITPTWLVHCIQSEGQADASTLSIKLETATAVDYSTTPEYKMMKDCGVFVSGIYTGIVGEFSNQSQHFIGLGEEPAANEFKEFLFKFIRQTRK